MDCVGFATNFSPLRDVLLNRRTFSFQSQLQDTPFLLILRLGTNSV